MRVLLVEDESELADALRTALQRHGLVIDVAPNLLQAGEALRQGVHDLVVLDRQLPDGDGVALIRRAREHLPGVPVIVLTARGSLPDRIAGLDQGADDYLVKPFEVEELLARIRAVSRRQSPRDVPRATVANLTFDFSAHEASIAGTTLRLPRRQLLVLEALCLRHGRTVSRNDLIEAVYDFDDEIQSNALDAHISKLRRSLEDAGADVDIHVIRGVGYLLRGKVHGKVR